VGFLCNNDFVCSESPNLTEDQFRVDWNGINNTSDFGFQLGYEPNDLTVGLDGNSLGGFSFSGNILPNTPISIYIFSDPIIKSTTSDSNGDWSIKVDEALPSGNHSVYGVMTTNDSVVRNSSVLTFSVDPEFKVVEMGDSNLTATQNGMPVTGDSETKITPVTTVTPPISSNSSTVWLVVLFVLIILSIVGVVILLATKNQKKDITNPIKNEIGINNAINQTIAGPDIGNSKDQTLPELKQEDSSNQPTIPWPKVEDTVK
jgi:flagellar basal body-associated protein FliL